MKNSIFTNLNKILAIETRSRDNPDKIPKSHYIMITKLNK